MAPDVITFVITIPVYGQCVRTTLRQYLDDWYDGKRAETAPSAMTFYRSSLAKFLQFLGRRSDDPNQVDAGAKGRGLPGISVATT
jgi:hypothetical protein